MYDACVPIDQMNQCNDNQNHMMNEAAAHFDRFYFLIIISLSFWFSHYYYHYYYY